MNVGNFEGVWEGECYRCWFEKKVEE